MFRQHTWVRLGVPHSFQSAPPSDSQMPADCQRECHVLPMFDVLEARHLFVGDAVDLSHAHRVKLGLSISASSLDDLQVPLLGGEEMTFHGDHAT